MGLLLFLALMVRVFLDVVRREIQQGHQLVEVAVVHGHVGRSEGRADIEPRTEEVFDRIDRDPMPGEQLRAAQGIDLNSGGRAVAGEPE